MGIPRPAETKILSFQVMRPFCRVLCKMSSPTSSQWGNCALI
ncbi:hypothetical protein PVAP13_7KG116920 [Panicum virgatum]|uniref:Uncharacterized protein n=1 Tax=Panicum virgatum TaxID=38727 RepID=A0A8T0QLC2_PANVG|nr:hypothetical protein PVAP13_7KG116920 [Panicum virgatum]